MAYGPVTHHLMVARQLLEDRDPATGIEAKLLAAARLSLDSTIVLVRRIHHNWHRWRDDESPPP